MAGKVSSRRATFLVPALSSAGGLTKTETSGSSVGTVCRHREQRATSTTYGCTCHSRVPDIFPIHFRTKATRSAPNRQLSSALRKFGPVVPSIWLRRSRKVRWSPRKFAGGNGSAAASRGRQADRGSIEKGNGRRNLRRGRPFLIREVSLTPGGAGNQPFLRVAVRSRPAGPWGPW
jgi:hypothetical protein